VGESGRYKRGGGRWREKRFPKTFLTLGRAAVQERALMSLQERYRKGRGTETNSFREVVSLDSKQLEGPTCKCTSWPPRGSILYLTFQSNDSCAMGSAVA
jgi:hypothetical protein